MVFQQTNAPTGWTKQTTHDNKALRLVTGTVGTGGSSNFTTALGTPALSGSTGSTTLSINQVPSHSHRIGWDSNVNANAEGARAFAGNAAFNNFWTGSRFSAGRPMEYLGGGGSHNHTMSGTASINVQYVDFIIANRD